MNQILKRKGFKEVERRQIIADDIAAKERARLATMTPFERALERVQNGAQLVAVPRFTKPAYAMTLGGVVGEL